MGCINASQEKKFGLQQYLKSEDSKNEDEDIKIEELRWSTRPSSITVKQKERNLVTDVDNFWNQFELKKDIGIGLLNKVIYTVLCRVSHLWYVAKVFKNQETFIKEVKLVCEMEDPHILKFKEAYRDHDAYYILYEHCTGEHLLKRIVRKEKYNEYLASKTVSMILHAVKYLHDKNIIHRDITPDAFFYQAEEDTRLKMFDFDLAMEINPEEDYSLRAGSPYFMAPEVIQNAEPRKGEIYKKADMWSLGVLVFLMLSGEYPFLGTSRDEIFEKVLTQKIKFKRSLSRDARDFVLKLLTRDLNARVSVDDALEHNWIMNSGKGDHQILKSTIEGLKAFYAKDSIEHALERLAAENLDAHDENHYKQLFGIFDFDGDGWITRAECVRALEMDKIYKVRAEEIADELIAKAGGDDKQINFENFRNMMVLHDLSSDEYRMDAVFAALDLNGDGYISIQELVMGLPHCNAKVIQKCIQKFQEADTDGDDQLSFSEFIKIFDHNIQEELHLKETGASDVHTRLNDRDKYHHH
jgi:calcium-dependent protein kinase